MYIHIHIYICVYIYMCQQLVNHRSQHTYIGSPEVVGCQRNACQQLVKQLVAHVSS